jgi:hypothetical protein
MQKMLVDLLEKQIDKISKEYVVQVVTDNGANFKATRRILMERIPTLFWALCASHCLDLMLDNIGKVKSLTLASITQRRWPDLSTSMGDLLIQ